MSLTVRCDKINTLLLKYVFTIKRMVTVCVKCKATMSTVYVCGNFWGCYIMWKATRKGFAQFYYEGSLESFL